jgi:hypothetical protein
LFKTILREQQSVRPLFAVPVSALASMRFSPTRRNVSTSFDVDARASPTPACARWQRLAAPMSR